MVKTAGLYLVLIASYSKNTKVSFILKRIVVQMKLFILYGTLLLVGIALYQQQVQELVIIILLNHVKVHLTETRLQNILILVSAMRMCLYSFVEQTLVSI
jgi:hypothetical protein